MLTCLHPGLGFKEGHFVLDVPVKVCLCLARGPGDTDKVPRLCTGPVHNMRLVNKPETGSNNSELSMPVNIPTNDHRTKPCATILCTLHDPGQILPCIKPDGNEQIFWLCPHARNIGERDRCTHPAYLPVAHTFNKVSSAVEHIRCHYHNLIATGYFSTVVKAFLFSDNSHHDL